MRKARNLGKMRISKKYRFHNRKIPVSEMFENVDITHLDAFTVGLRQYLRALELRKGTRILWENLEIWENTNLKTRVFTKYDKKQQKY